MRSRGFTLIEMLVVLVIIGVIVSLATVALGDNRGEQLEQEARRLSALLQLASDESILSSAPIGLRITATSYAFYRQGRQSAQELADQPVRQEQPEWKWQAITNDRQLRERELPEPLHLALVIDGDSVQRASPALEQQDSEQPQAVFVSSGELEPGFELTLSHPELQRSYLIVARPDGQFEFHAQD